MFRFLEAFNSLTKEESSFDTLQPRRYQLTLRITLVAGSHRPFAQSRASSRCPSGSEERSSSASRRFEHRFRTIDRSNHTVESNAPQQTGNSANFAISWCMMSGCFRSIEAGSQFSSEVALPNMPLRGWAAPYLQKVPVRRRGER